MKKNIKTEKKKKTSGIKFHKAIFSLTRIAVTPLMRKKYSFTTDNVPDTGEPFILVANHTTEDDMFLAGIASHRHMYYVCGEHLLRDKRYGRIIRSFFAPIPVPKGGMSLEAVREIIRRTKAGNNICIFPEGKRSFHGETIPSSAALGKLIKKSGCALVTYRIRGGYFTYPRWARHHHRKGHVEGKLMGVYSSSQLGGMSVQEVTDIINRDTYENAYEVQREKMWKYTGTDRAKGLEHLLFICPSCGGMDTIKTEGDELCCTSCGMKAVYNDYGFFEGENLPFDNVHSWMRWIEPEFDRYVEENTNVTAPGSSFAEPAPETFLSKPAPEDPLAKPEPGESLVKPEPPDPLTKPEPEDPLVKPEPEDPLTKPEPGEPLAKPEPETSLCKPSSEEIHTKTEPKDPLAYPEPADDLTKPGSPQDEKLPADGMKNAQNNSASCELSQNEEKPLFTEENVLLYRMLDDYKNEDILTDTLHIYKDRMLIAGREFRFEDIPQLSMLFGSIILFTHEGTYYGLRGDSFRAWKSARLWHLTKGDTADRTKEI